MKSAAVWFDFENSPHPWILKDLIKDFRARGYTVIVTARDYAQTIPITEMFGIEFTQVGAAANSHSSLKKVTSLVKRSWGLLNEVRSYKPVLAISHGSRSQALAAKLMGCYTVSFDDYEHSFKWFNSLVNTLYTPSCIPKNSWGIPEKRVVHYPGIKEDIYLWNRADFVNISFPFIDPTKINVLFRPAGDFSHYQDESSFTLQKLLLQSFQKHSNLKVILSARSKEQEKRILNDLQQLGVDAVLPGKVANGPALIEQVDLIIGGGGTMTREACVLGTPSFSFFGGETGAVDAMLIATGKLKLLSSAEDVTQIKLVKKPVFTAANGRSTYDFLLNELLQLQVLNNAKQ